MQIYKVSLASICLILIACTPGAAPQGVQATAIMAESTPEQPTIPLPASTEEQLDVQSCPEGNCPTVEPTSAPAETQDALFRSYCLLQTASQCPGGGLRSTPSPGRYPQTIIFSFNAPSPPITSTSSCRIIVMEVYSPERTLSTLELISRQTSAHPSLPQRLEQSPGRGMVFTARRKPTRTIPYGKAVVIRHDFGHKGKALYTVYAHLNQIDVAEGQWVDVGQQVGLVGNTGFHFRAASPFRGTN